MILEFLATDADNQAYTPKGVRSELKILSVNGIDEDDTITLSWTEPDGTTGNITFTAKDSPSLSTEFISDDAPGKQPSPIGYWKAVAATINAHPTVNRHFKVYAIQYDLLPTPDYSLFVEVVEVDRAWVLNMSSSTALTITNHDTPLATTAPDNYTIFVDIFFEEIYESGEWDRIATIELPLNQSGRSYLDISEILDKALKGAMSELNIPEFNSTTPYVADNIRQYYFRYREDYDDVTPSWTVSSNKLALCGGIAQNLAANYNLFDNLKSTNSLLTYYPNGKSVSPDQPEWIAWYNYDSSAHETLLQVRTWTADSATATMIYRLDGNGIFVAEKRVLLIPVGPNQLSIGDTVVKYEITVIDKADYDLATTTPLSQTRSYYIDRLTYREKRYIMYLNSFCVPETLRCIGDFKDQLDVSREVFERPLPPKYSDTARQIDQYDQDYTNRFTYRTGYLSKSEADALQELLIYNDAYEVSAEGYIPLHITNNRHDIYETSNFLFSHTIQAEPRLKRKNYSNILIPLTVDKDAWITATLDYWTTIFSEPWQTP